MDTDGRFLRVRSVVGHSTDPYRGVKVAPATPREPSAATPLASLLDTLRKVDGISVTHARKMIVLARDSDEVQLRIHVDVDPVALPDLTLEGNPTLAILALHALLPMFGGVEIRDDDYTDVIDGTEPIDEVVKRFQAKVRADLAKIRATISVIDPVEDNVESPPVRRARRNLTIAGIVAVAVAVTLFGLWAFRAASRRAPSGAPCSNSPECESRECLSPQPLDGTPHDEGTRQRYTQPSITGGVCTQPCRDDTECPKDMTCGDALQDMGTHRPLAIKRCMPMAWQPARQ